MPYSVGVIIISDRAYRGKRKDSCLEVFQRTLDNRFEIIESTLTNDNPDMIEKSLNDLISKSYNLIFTSGGTGCAERDNTPEVTSKLLDKPTPGIDEAIRTFSKSKSPYAIYSRAVSGIANKSLIINLPGSPKAVKEILEFLLKTIEHPLKLLANQVADCQEELKNEKL
jgi:molybdenum cofactor synthesis domain-containing protein